ncbi:DUF6236 family protein [Streptomyces sp. MMS24-I31]|uniref:DUF6236 family protein n=1 Tax=Streptomyces sp. MMS24-I31 TaxID=3351563 RepID=UPI003896D7C1
MSDIALYYPNLSFSNEAWLKAAALYWPKIARLDLTWMLDDLEEANELELDDFFVRVQVSEEVKEQLAEGFSDLLGINSGEIARRYGLTYLFPEAPRSHGFVQLTPEEEAKLTLVHVGKLEVDLLGELVEQGLTQGSRYFAPADGAVDTVVMHPRFALAYSSALAGCIATENNLVPVTDKSGLHSSIDGMGVAAAGEMLLKDEWGSRVRSDAELAEAIASIAVEAVIPANLVDIPMSKIAEIRRALGEELIAFRCYVQTLADNLSELATVGDPSVFESHLRQIVAKEVEPKVQSLERAMRGMRIDTARRVIGAKESYIGPSATSGIGWLSHAPASVVGAVSCLMLTVTYVHELRAGRTEAREQSPVAYLLDLQRRLA